MKHIILLILSCFLLGVQFGVCQTKWDGQFPNSSSTYSGGDGSLANPYIIKTAQDLALLVVKTNAEESYTKGKYFKLTENIDLDNGEWTPIGKGAKFPFFGVFDGNNKTISKLKITQNISYVGLFGVLGTDATVVNLNVANAQLNSSSMNLGVIAGRMEHSTVSNCSASGKIVNAGSNNEVGGIVGYLLSATVSNCVNSTDIDSWGKFTGGITGFNSEGEITACYNVGNLAIKDNANQPRAVGGICGENHGTISTSFNMGSIMAERREHRGGGIAGVNYSKISYTYNLGRFYGSASDGQQSYFLGGLVGHNVDDKAIVEYSYHFGFQQSSSPLNNGALVGTNTSNSIVRYCYSDKQVDTNKRLIILGKLTHCAPLLTREFIGTNMSDRSKVYNLGDPTQWIFEEGKYPRLAKISIDNWVRLSVAPFILIDSDNCWRVTENFALDTTYGVRWESTNIDNLRIDGDTARLSVDCNATANVTITATLGEAEKTSPIYAHKASAGSIKTIGQTISDRHISIQTIHSEISPSGGKYTWEVRFNGGDFQPIPEATEESYTPTQSENGTYEFRRRVAVARCNYSEFSEGVWTLKLNYSVGIYQQPLAQTICHQNTATLTIGVRTTETSVRYQWQFSSDSVTWKNIYEGGTQAKLTTLKLTTPTYYRCLVSDDQYKTRDFSSDIVKITLLDQFRIITSPNIVDVCPGSDVTMSAGAKGGSDIYTYQWEGAKMGGYEYELIEGADSANYTFKIDGTSYSYFQCRITDEFCGQDLKTLNGRVTLKKDQTPGAITNGRKQVCYNYTPSIIESLLPASAGEAVYKWQMSKDLGRSFSDIENATTSSYTPTIRTEAGTYIYRRMAKDESCYSDWTSSYGADTIIINPLLKASLAVTSNYNGIQISQKGAKDGRIEVSSVSSIHKPYTYSWLPTGANTEIITNAGEGLHTLTITDTLGCTTTASETIMYVTLTPEVIQDTLRLYVTNLGQGNRTGQNWDHALPNNLLQDALDYLGVQTKKANAQLGEVWLGVGLNSFVDSTFIRIKPTRKSPFAPVTSTNDRDLSFVIPSGVSLFGGFKGNERKKIDRSGRLDAQICTLLTGELDSGERVYNVLVFGDGFGSLAKPSIVDGVLVMSGNANSTGTNDAQKRGAGVTMVGNSIFRSGGVSDCSASGNGGGVYMMPGSWLVSNLIEKCSAKIGGGVYTTVASSLADGERRVNIIENTIVNNKALSEGAGCYINNYIFMYGNVVWNNTINTISRNCNVKLANDNGSRSNHGYDVTLHDIRTLYANDDFTASYGLLPFVLSDKNRDPKGPNFLDPFNDNGMLNPIPRGSFQLDAESSLIQATPDYIQSEADLVYFKLDVQDPYGNKRFVTALDIGAFENQRLVVMKPTNNRLYVSDRRRGEVDGSSWDNATNSLQRALNYFADKKPEPGERFEVWVSEGVYYPSSLSEFGYVDRNLSYTLRGYTDIYGGFTGENGTEGQMNDATRPRVDLDGNGLVEAWEFKHTTILSGEISVVGGSGTNAYHVIYIDPADNNSITADLILDGLFITAGNANGEGHDSKGSGLYTRSPLSIQNCAFVKNFGSSKTQGIAIYASTGLDIKNSCIMQNYQSNVHNDTTAAIYFEDDANFTQCLITDNDMIGVYSPAGTLDLKQSTIVKNMLAVRAYKGHLSNSVIWGNTESQQVVGTPSSANNSAVQGLLLPGEGNLNLNALNSDPQGPRFRSIESPFAYYPDCASPLLDKGVATVGLIKDITMSPRIHQGFVDIGAYESQVDSIVTGSIANTGNEICYNTISTVEISSIEQAFGGILPITYQWTANGELLADSDKASLVPPKALKENTVFKRLVSDARCNFQKLSEGEWLVNVYDELKAKQTGNDTVVCFNASTPLHVDVNGGSGTQTFQWQMSTDNRTFTNFETADARTASMLAPAQNKNYYVRCQIGDSKCGSIYSDTLQIQNYAEFKAGTIDGTGQIVCQGQVNTLIPELETSLGGVPPYTYSWYVSGKKIDSDAAKAKEYIPLLTSVGVHPYKRYVSDSICTPTPLASEGEWQLNILKRPSVTISGDTIIAYGQEAKIRLEFEGTPNFSYRLIHDTANRTSSTTHAEITVAPLETQDYSVIALSDGSICTAKAQDLYGNARVNVYYNLITLLKTPNTGTVEAYKKADGTLITPQTRLSKIDTVLVKLKPSPNYYLKNKNGVLHNGKDSTRVVFANYMEEYLVYTFPVTESVKLELDFLSTTSWDANSIEPFKSVTGDSLLIYHPAELSWLSSSQNTNESFQKKAIKLMNNLDLGGSENINFNPIGHSENAFQGFFDGNTKTISNLRAYYSSSERSNVGLFGNIGVDGYVKNFKLLSGLISSNLNHVGAVAGRCNGTIEQVYNHIPVVGGAHFVGGLVGLLEEQGKIVNSYNAANISVPLNGSYVGGLVGQSAGSIVQSFNIGYVFGLAKVGGLIGETLPSASMEYCYNAGEISGSKDVNGFIGFNSSDKISNSYTVGGYRAIRTTMDGWKELQASCFTDIFMTSTPNEELMSTPKTTLEMIGMTLQSSLGDADKWEFTSNIYPRLKAMKDLDASIVSVLPIFFAESERKDSLKSNFTYAEYNEVIWTSSVSDQDPITILEGNASVTRKCGSDQIDTLTIVKGGAVRVLSAKVLGYPNFNSGKIAEKGENLCFGETPAQIGETIAPIGSETNTYTYSWYKDEVEIISSDAKNANYTPTETASGSYVYTRKVAEAHCNPSGTLSQGQWMLTIKPDLSLTKYTENQSICYETNIDLSFIVEGGDGTYTYKWEQSQDKSTWSNALNSTNATSHYSTPNLTQKTYFRCAVESCGIKDTVQGMVDVYEQFNSGTIPTESLHLCYGVSAGPIVETTSVSGGVPPYTYQWIRKSGSVSRILPLNISSYTPASMLPISKDTSISYIREVKDDKCNTSFTSSIGEVTVTTYPKFEGSIAVTSNYFGLPLSAVGASDASVEVTPIGGSKNYIYTWQKDGSDIAPTTAEIKNLSAATYKATIYSVVNGNKLACPLIKEITILPILFKPAIINADTLRIYATYQGDGNRNGDSWNNAIPNTLLQASIDYLDSIQGKNADKSFEIWLGVGKDLEVGRIGTAYFYPSKRSPYVNDDTDPRAKSFVLPAGINIFGAFYGTETSKNERTDRSTIRTILSGYFSEKDRLAINSAHRVYNVLVFGDGKNPLAKPTLIDGVSLMHGNANSTDNSKPEFQQGGGTTLLFNAIMRNGYAGRNYAKRGGGLYVKAGSWLTGSIFVRDTAEIGAGIYVETAQDGDINDVKKRANLVANTIVQCEAIDNTHATVSGAAGLYLGDYVFMANTVAWDNKYNGISADNNVKLENGYDPLKYLFQYVAYNDLSKNENIEGEILLTDENRLHNTPEERERDKSRPYPPMFLDPYHPSAMTLKGYSLDIASPLKLIEEDAIVTEQESLAKYRLDELDYTGNPRLVGKSMDIGAYEMQDVLTLNAFEGRRLYVSRYPRGKRDGSSWSDATNSLQYALEYFEERELPQNLDFFEVWVSEGDYIPSKDHVGNNNPIHRSFILNDKTHLYGGFIGTEESIDDRVREDKTKNGVIEKWEFSGYTTLSGEILVGTVGKQYVRHVIYRPASSKIRNIIVDGFAIQKSLAVDESEADRHLGGGAIWAEDSIQVQNCVFFEHRGLEYAQGVAIYAKNATIKDCFFSANENGTPRNKKNITASLLNLESSKLQSSVIIANYMIAVELKGNSNILLNNTILLNNVGVKMSESSTNILSNNVIWKNYSLNDSGDTTYNEFKGSSSALNNNAIQGMSLGVNGINLSKKQGSAQGPRFTFLEEAPNRIVLNNLIPDCFSPLLNTGIDVELDTTDMACVARKFGTAIDVGAFESQIELLNPGVIDSTGEEICYGKIPTLEIKSLEDKSGGKSTSGYIWYANNETIEGANSATYRPMIPLMETTVFSRWTMDDCFQAEDLGLQAKGTYTVRVQPELKLPTPAAQTICNNSSALITIEPTGGDGVYTYQWYMKNEADENYTKLDGEIGKSLQTPTLSKTTGYQCEVGSCDQIKQSASIVISVNSPLKVQIQPSPFTICHNAKASLSTKAQGGRGLYTYCWQKRKASLSESLFTLPSGEIVESNSTNPSAEWENIPNSNIENYISDPLSENTHFRCKINSCGNDTIYTNIVLISILPKIEFVTQSKDKAVCYNSTAELKVQVSGGKGTYLYQWKKASIDGNDWQNAPGVSTKAEYTTEVLTITPYQYHCIVTDGCENTTIQSDNIKLTNLPILRILSQVKATDTICYNTNAQPLKIEVDGGDGKYEYEWMKKLNNGNWEMVNKSGSSSYTPSGQQTQTHRYKCVVSSCGNSQSSKEAEIFVRGELKGGAILDTTIPICFGEEVPLIKNIESPSGGSGRYKITWINEAQVEYEGIHSYDFKPNVSESGTYFFQRKVTDTVCSSSALAGSFKLIINQEPEVESVNNQILCANESSAPVVFRSTNTEGTLSYTWTNNKTGYGLSSKGEGDIPSYKAVNPGYVPDSLTINVSPILSYANKSCQGKAVSFVYIINPSPHLNQILDSRFCAGTSNNIEFSSLNTGGENTFAWSSSLGDNSMSYIGLPSPVGSGNISFVSANNQNTSQTTQLTIVPSFTANGKTCVAALSAQKTINITVDPIPKLLSADTIAAICSGSAINYTPKSNVSNAMMTWKRPALPTINEGTASEGDGRISGDILRNNMKDQIQEVLYEYTISANACQNTSPYVLRAKVYPSFEKGSIGSSTQILCNNAQVAQPSITEAIGGNGITSYEWREQKDAAPSKVVATTANYVISAKKEVGTYIYTRWVKNGTCNSAWIQSSGEHSIRVLPSLTSTIMVTSNFNGLHIEEPEANNGRAKIVVSGGLTPYTYLWSSSETIDSITNKAPGKYTVSVLDANACSLDTSVIIKSILFTPKIIADTSRFYVSYLGDGLRNGSSWENALPRQVLQYALDTAGKIAQAPEKHAEVWVGIGANYNVQSEGVATFSPKSIRKHSPFVSDLNDPRAKSFVIPSGVGLYGGFAGRETNKSRPNRSFSLTVLSGDLNSTPNMIEDDAYNVVVFGDGLNDLEKPAYLNGFVIISGNANHPTIEFMQCGGGIVSVSNAAVQSVVMTDNKALKGGAVYMQGKSYLNSSLLYANKANQGGAVYTKTANAISSGPCLAYNTIVNNEAYVDGAGLYLQENLTFMGNVVWNNTIGKVSQNNNIKLSSMDYLKYKSDYIFANDSMVPFFGITSMILSNSNTDSLHNGPMFFDPLKDNGHASPYQSKAFTLTLHSPIRNQSELIQIEYQPAALRLEAYDIYGFPRKIGGAIDFNAAEYEQVVYPKPTNNRLYVSNQRRGAVDGSSWENSMTNLSLAIAYLSSLTPAAGERFEIWISGGTFFPQMNIPGTNDIRHYSFILNENIDIYGGFRGLPGDENRIDRSTRPHSDLDGDGYVEAWEYENMTSLSGNIEPSLSGFHTYHVVYRTQGELNSTIDGLEIREGNANGHTLQDSLGGGLYTEKPMTIRNCVFVSNKASKSGHGSAIYAVNSLIDGSYIAANYVDSETQDTNITTGALAMVGGIIQNSIIAMNSTSALVTLGNLPPSILNTTIADNTAGIVNLADANTSITNTIIWNNKRILNNEMSYSSILHLNGSLSVSYSAMEDAALKKFTKGNLHLDRENEALYGPHFIRVNDPDRKNNYRLNCLSPLINAGDSAKWTMNDVDFGGNARIVEQVDMGACETQSLSFQGGEIESKGEAICDNSVPTQTIENISFAHGGIGNVRYNWFYNDTLIEGAVEATYLPTQRLTKDAVYMRYSYNECGQKIVAKGEWTVRVNAIPSATLSGGAHLDKGDSTNLQIVFTGKAPFTFRLNTDSGDRVHISNEPLLLTVSPSDTILYKITSFADANACNVPADSIKGEAYILVSDYVNVQVFASLGGEIILSKAGKVLKGTSISVHITPNGNYYLQRLSTKTGNNTIALHSIPVYADLAQENLIAEFIATQDTNIIGVFAPLTPWKQEIESARFTKDSNTVYIYTAGELAYIAKQIDEFGKTYENVQFKLMRNLDMGGVQENTGSWNEKTSSQWLPLGGNGDTSFRGKFDGNNKQITNLYINKKSENVGLFGHLGADAEVNNLAITAGFIKGSSNVGSIAGVLDSNACISQVFSMADVQAEQSHAGGLVGINKGTIANAYNVGHIEALNYAGGIAALNTGSINYAYNIGQIKGGMQTFGIASDEGKISQSYFDKQMIGRDYKETALAQPALYTSDFDTVFANNPLWHQNPSHYPSLVAFDTTQASALSILNIQLHPKEHVHKLRSDIFICQDHNIRMETLNDTLKVASVRGYGLDIKRAVLVNGDFTLKVSNAAYSRYLNLSVEAIRTSNVELFDSICSGSSYTFGERELSQSGIYYDTLLNRYEDDSLVTLNLIVIGEEKIEVDTIISICTFEKSVYLDFNVITGYPTTYNLIFDSLSKSMDFTDSKGALLANNKIQISMPDHRVLPPNEYTALLEFKNHADCPASKVTIKIKRNFDAEQIIQQKDNFMLYLKNSDYNGGYKFKSYQWLFDDRDLYEETKSYYYTQNNLRTDGHYSVTLQLENGVMLDVCPFKAQIVAQEVKVYPSNIKRGQNYVVSLLNFGYVPENTYVELFDMQGKLLETKRLTTNESVFAAPRYTGVYIVKVAIPNRTVQTFKIVVN